MGGSFGKKRANSVSEQEKVILRLKQQREKLKQCQQESERDCKSDRELAKQSLVEGDRDKAKDYLRKKRYHQQLLRNSNAQLDKIDQLTLELELVQIKNEIAKLGKKKGKRNKWILFLKTRNKQHPRSTSVHEDAIPVLNNKERDKVMARTRGRIEKQQEISELISRQLRNGDEGAVEAELDAMLDAGHQLSDMRRETFTYIKVA